MKNIILVFPEPAMDVVKYKGVPLSIFYPGAFVEKRGFNVEYVDLRIDSIDVLTKLVGTNPLLVGVSSMTGYQLKGAIATMKLVKQLNPKIPVVLGGVHASMLPDQSLKEDFVDFVVVGEGEMTLFELAVALDNGQESFEHIKGLGWKKDNYIQVNGPREFLDMDQIPAPITESSERLYKYYSWAKVEVSRGCPHKCAFCYNAVFNRGEWRFKSIAKVQEEITFLKTRLPGISNVTLLSDNIGKNKGRLLDISNFMKEEGLTWHTGMRIDYIDKELLDILEESCTSLFFGVESASERILKLINKGVTTEQVLASARLVGKSKIVPYYSFMCGYPDETDDELYTTLELADELMRIDSKAVITPFFLCTPYPGTELYSLAQSQAISEPSSMEEWSNYNFNTARMPWIKEKKFYENVYYVSLLALYAPVADYSETDFERGFINYLQECAKSHWKARDFNFSSEVTLFKLYNKNRELGGSE